MVERPAPPAVGAIVHVSRALTIPIFPLPGAILFPRAQLPLHIFEPRYRDMVRDAIDGAGRIGMIQPLRFDDDNHAPGCERCLTLHTQQSPHLRVAGVVRALCMHDRHVRIERRNCSDAFPRVRALHRPDHRIHARQVRALVIPQRTEWESCSARAEACDHAKVRVLLHRERRRIRFNGPTKGVQRARARIARP